MCARPARARATTQLRLKPWPERRELCLLAVSGSPAARSLQAAGRGNMIEMDAEAAAQPPPLPSPSLSLPLPFLFLSSPSPPPLPPSGPWIREASLYVKFSSFEACAACQWQDTLSRVRPAVPGMDGRRTRRNGV